MVIKSHLSCCLSFAGEHYRNLHRLGVHVVPIVEHVDLEVSHVMSHWLVSHVMSHLVVSHVMSHLEVSHVMSHLEVSHVMSHFVLSP